MKLRVSLGVFVGALVLGILGLHTFAAGHEAPAAAMAADAIHTVPSSAGETPCDSCAEDPGHAAVAIGCILALLGFVIAWRIPTRRFWYFVRSRAPGSGILTLSVVAWRLASQKPPSLTALGISRT
ncbi:DUF6153 family protein [Aeromicrobium piscarium]|uniref:Cytochrome c biogenesis protein ResB n=1 Tax=Aeromicrobium piscarium TaxID=2590901 RepID=A0A554RFT7_9ACTN|nr:DUF6153 family protein [Aeromicrobium piscarium]TSD52969.1 cytochrome c biogenesis protein ResB [Aeromicrobium piscarium]